MGSPRRAASGVQVRANVEAELNRLFRGKLDDPLASEIVWLLDHYSALVAHQKTVDHELLTAAADNEICRRFMEIPGVGPMCALAFFTTVSEPHRFRRSSDIGAYLGLTPKLYQSGLTSRMGRISKMGNAATRAVLVQAAMSLMRHGDPDSDLWTWASHIEQRRGRNRAKVALARKLAVVMTAMWKSGQRYDPRRLQSSAAQEGEIGPRMA